MESLFKPIQRKMPDLSSMMPESVNRVKIMALGDPGVGKSCLIKRFCEGRFLEKYISTIGIDYGVREVRVAGKSVKVNFWDVSGHPQYLEIRNEFYSDSQCIIVIYDISNRQSFSNIGKWLTEAVECGFDQARSTIVLVGTKTDKTRAISTDEGKRLAETNGFAFFEASAKSGEGVADMFTAVFQAVCKKAWAE
ncbi:Small GTPase superfamily [Carpediemonas membranifera]|uniref:Small GTPase superfamily n=1 Tax=Carpediemonas membranifera TaxID=201153 RepID=A0A8J6AVV0_9EUKA|nr:Small GTPase superfamily [Carpediemonas membranifera]|eukprot:KAG9393800.1 Small GTPase superfamily [Carpediemonas membranifera]